MNHRRRTRRDEERNLMSTMPIKSIAPWFGGKRSLAPVIVQEAGKHLMYVEPFAGSMATIFAKPRSTHETVNDLHGHVINLARVLQSEELRLWLLNELRHTLYSSDLFDESRHFIESICPSLNSDAMPSASAAYHYFIVSWMGRNGVAGTKRVNYQKATRWTPGGGSGPTRFRNAVECIPAWAERLRNVDILCMDAFDLIGRLDDVDGVVIYADPPYLRGTRGSSEYEHEFEDGGDGMFATHDDHARLATALSRFQRARVIVSYYADARLAELYPQERWTHRAVTRQKNLHVQNRRGDGACEAPEVLIINGPSNGV